MSRVKQIATTILAIGLVLSGLAAVYWVMISGPGLLAQLDPGVAAAVVAGLVAVFGYFYNQRQARARHIAESHRLKKIEVYETFLDIIDWSFEATHTETLAGLQEGEVPEDLKKLFIKLNRGLISWGSPGVIQKWLAFRTISVSSPPHLQVILQMDDVLQAIRKDLHNSNFGLKRGDLVKLFLSDPTELDRTVRQQ